MKKRADTAAAQHLVGIEQLAVCVYKDEGLQLVRVDGACIQRCASSSDVMGDCMSLVVPILPFKLCQIDPKGTNSHVAHT